MKVTKFEHSCLLVEMPAPENRTILFDPGVMSQAALDIDALEFLEDIVITHGHGDHLSIPVIQQLVAKFPTVRITAPAEVVDQLEKEDITAYSDPSDGISFFDAPHESVAPLFPQPESIGVHFLDLLSHPGDSHSFTETKAVLALPITAPWGSTVKAVNLALALKPKYILPIHDWHWRDEARQQMYSSLEPLFAQHDIVFLPLTTGSPVVIDF
ncbi:MAG: MBL fold metallo-hydrolase [Patescibacteria group bacterium]|nr:MBL fold metallo-hydrolase [Patescibacteria group bacterium]